jgi:anti-anti-sigma factor
MIIQSRMESDGTAVLTIMAKNLTYANAAEFREEARPVIEASAGEVVVDCTQVEFADSSGIGALLHANSMMTESRRPVRLTGVGKKVLAGMELMMVHRQFTLEPRK